MPSLFDSAPGFDQPLAVLKHCHDRIRKQLATLDKLLSHLRDHGIDENAQQAAKAVLRYFNKAAPLHHEDEEIDLLPTLQSCVTGEDAELLSGLLATILGQHRQMEQLWQTLAPQLVAIEDGSGVDLSASDIDDFTALYTEHMQIEETQIAPMAQRLFSQDQMHALGAAMQARRGITN